VPRDVKSNTPPACWDRGRMGDGFASGGTPSAPATRLLDVDRTRDFVVVVGCSCVSKAALASCHARIDVAARDHALGGRRRVRNFPCPRSVIAGSLCLPVRRWKGLATRGRPDRLGVVMASPRRFVWGGRAHCRAVGMTRRQSALRRGKRRSTSATPPGFRASPGGVVALPLTVPAP
jgi:hypothetical protein